MIAAALDTQRKPIWFSIVSSGRGDRVPIRDIQRSTCESYGVSLNDLLSSRRSKGVAAPRHVSMYLAKELTGLSYPQIGGATGDRDHTTAIYAHRKIENLIKIDVGLAMTIAAIRLKLDGDRASSHGQDIQQ